MYLCLLCVFYVDFEIDCVSVVCEIVESVMESLLCRPAVRPETLAAAALLLCIPPRAVRSQNDTSCIPGVS